MVTHQQTIDDAIQQELDEEAGSRLATSIRQSMQQQRISERELGRRLGWSQTMVNRRLAGKTAISAVELLKISHALETTPKALGYPVDGGRRS